MRALSPACPPKARRRTPRRKPLGRRIDRGRKTRRAGAHDGDVERPISTVPPHHSKGACQVCLTGILQNGALGTHRQGKVARVRRIFVDEIRGIAIPRRIKHLIGIGVPGEEALQPHDIGSVLGPDQHRSAGARFNQGGAAQNSTRA